MRSIRRFLLFLIIVVAALAVSNPDLRKHQDKIIEKYNQENPLSGSFGAGEIIKRVIAYDNYYLFSLGKISITNETVSFGIAGFVIVFESLDVLKYKDMFQK